MKKFLLMAATIAAAVGCNTTKSGKTADYAADVPPPLVKGDAPPPGEPKQEALPAPKGRVSAAEIDEGNVLDHARRLESDMRSEKKAVAGR